MRKSGGIIIYVVYRSYRDVAQFGRALRSGRRGRRFESCHLDHIFKKHAGFYQRAFSFISPFLKQEGNENHVCGERCF